MLPVLLDTDTLSEILKRRDDIVLQTAQAYLDEWQRFTLSVLTRYEILRGLRAKGAVRQELAFTAFAKINAAPSTLMHTSVLSQMMTHSIIIQR